MYSRTFRLIEDSKAGLIAAAASLGNPSPPDTFSCRTCVGTHGSLSRGFRAEVYGVVVAPSSTDGTPPLLHVVDARASNEIDNRCSGPFPGQQNLEFGVPLDTGPRVISVSVGDKICYEGFVMDHHCIHQGTFVDHHCIHRGTFLDAPNVVR